MARLGQNARPYSGSLLQKHNAAIYGCFVASAKKQADNSALWQLASIVAHCYN
jgi:hypothetical protein